MRPERRDPSAEASVLRRLPAPAARRAGLRAGAPARAVLAAALLPVLAGACLSYSPHEVPLDGRNLRAESLARLESGPAAERLRFAVVGDVQRGFDEARDAVARLNQIEDLAFVVQVGDFSDCGRADEFETMAAVFSRLRVPWFVAVGNHDLLGNGGTIFDALFGPRSTAFTHLRTRFVLLDTNSREYGFAGGVPDLGWLEAQLAPGPDHDRAVVFSHVPPWSGDFDPALRDAFVSLLAEAGVALSFHGHDHTYLAEVHEGVPYVVTDHVEVRTLLLVEEEHSGELEVERIWF